MGGGGKMRALTALLVCLCGVATLVGAESAADSNAVCTDTQNEAKTSTAQSVLDCGTQKCKSTQGDAHAEQACLCQNCVAEDKAAKDASCACGLSDPNSASACKIYQRLYTTCSGAASVQTGAVFVIAVLTTVMQWSRQ